MLFVNYEDCNGCGACLEACNFEAILLQNDKAIIDQERCQGCQACMEACPSGAMVYTEKAVQPKPIMIPAEPAFSGISPVEAPAQSSLREMIWPAIGSALLWTGRELLPRLANYALKTLDQRVLYVDQGTRKTNQPDFTMRERRISPPVGGQRRRLRQRHNRRKK